MVIDLKENTGSGKIGKLIDKAAELFRNRTIVAGLLLNKLGIRIMGGFMIGSALNDIILAARAAVISRRTKAAKEKQLSEGELI